MNPHLWTVTLYWRDPTYARDFDALVRGGRVEGDTPARWFTAAAGAYAPISDIGHRACLAMAINLSGAVQ